MRRLSRTECVKIPAGLSAAALLVSGVVAANAQQRVTVVGCPAPGVEARCMVMRGGDGVTYNISGANPAPAIGQRAIRLTGTRSTRASYCQQGVVLTNISWIYTNQPCR